jgi:hypothetical protein
VHRSLLLFGGIAVVAVAVITWAVADILYDISLPRCVSGRRVSSCGGDEGWHGVSSLITALLGIPALMTLAGSYLVLASRLVRARKAKHRESFRKAVRLRFALTLLAAVVIALPATLLARSTL